MTSKLSTDVLIIGAGWSGLTAALRLSQAGRKVIVVEARERIGGRAFTHSWNDKTTLDDIGRNVQSDGKSYTCDFGTCTPSHELPQAQIIMSNIFFCMSQAAAGCTDTSKARRSRLLLTSTAL